MKRRGTRGLVHRYAQQQECGLRAEPPRESAMTVDDATAWKLWYTVYDLQDRLEALLEAQQL